MEMLLWELAPAASGWLAAQVGFSKIADSRRNAAHTSALHKVSLVGSDM
jgi:hypothetical protein